MRRVVSARLFAVFSCALFVLTVAQELRGQADPAEFITDGEGFLVMMKPPNQEAWEWTHVGGLPLVPGGVKTTDELLKFVRSDLFRQVLLDNFNHEQIAKIIEQIEEGVRLMDQKRVRRVMIAPDSSEAYFLDMYFGVHGKDGRPIPGRFQKKEAVIWRGSHDLDSWFLDIEYGPEQLVQFVIPVGCGNIGLRRPVFQVEKTAQPPPVVIEKEKPVEVIKEVVKERTIEKPCPSCPECPPCEPDESWGIIGEYYPKSSKAKKVRVDPKTFIIYPPDQAVRQQLAGMIATVDPEFFTRKVQFALALFNFCQPRVRLYWYREGWHWKEFFVGYVLGVGTGIPIGRLLKECPTGVKQPWEQIPNPGRPTVP
ncbi:MAG: hypothetical protein HY396_02270 [Candidatus Doudnabacteria bacterium]|nr:hypothetical protein [Candidatus Doudnabacteria bacterium]